MLVYPGDASSAVQIPSNTAQAFLEVLATGAAEEVRSLSTSLAELELIIYYVQEFWYTNVLDEYREVYPDAGLIGRGPFREVQLRIDNLLGQYRLYHLTHSVTDRRLICTAGVVHPFPVIYTGGANPLLWRPVAGLRAFDIPSFWIDVTPYLPM